MNVGLKRNSLYLFIIAAFLLFSGLGSSPIYILDEARNAQCAREMKQRNDWLIPTFNAELRPHKPPLHYYFMRFGYMIFGTNELGARFFSAVAGFFTLVLTWYFAKRYLARTVAIVAVSFLLMSAHFLFEFRLAVPDPYLIFFTVATFFSFFEYVQTRNFLLLVIAATSTGLAILAKGPVAIALPSLAIFTWLLWEKKLPIIFSWKMIVAFLIVCAVAFPWYWLIHDATNGEFTKEFFFTHNISRFSEPMEGHGGIFLLTLLFVVFGMLPGTVFIGQSFQQTLKQTNPSLIKLSIVVVAVFVVFYSISNTKLPNYPMPCYPFVALLIAHGLDRYLVAAKSLRQYPFVVLFCITLLLTAASYFAIKFEPALKGMKWICLAFLILPSTAYFSFYTNKKKDLETALKFLFTGYVIFNAVFLLFMYPHVYKQNPVTKTLDLLDPNKQVYAYEIYNPAFNFYLNKPVKKFTDTAELQSALQKDTSGILITRLKLLSSIDTTKYQVLAIERDLFESSTTVLLKLK